MGRFIGGGRNGPAAETPEGRLAMEIPARVLRPAGTSPIHVLEKPAGCSAGFFCAASNRSGRVPPPLGENGQRCCGLKAPMVLIRSSKSSRETSVCPLIFDR